MNKKLVTLALILSFTLSAPVFASDWGKVGKILTGIEGLRIITGGNVDVIGSMTGINSNRDYSPRHTYSSRRKHRNSRRIWVPEYEWRRRYVPGQKRYGKRHGRTRGYYVEYRVETGGHWEYRRPQRLSRAHRRVVR